MSIGVPARPAVWCDFAGVLTAPVTDTFTTFCAKIRVRPEFLMASMLAVAREFGTDDIMLPLDTPLLSGIQWVREMESVLARDFATNVDLSRFAELWFAERPPNTAMIDFVRTLRAEGVFVGMVSNMPPDFDPYWRAIVEPELFDEVILSYEVGCRKPDRDIYELCAVKASVPATSCVLIDDLAVNCRGAVDNGWQAVEFKDTDDAITRVREAVGL
ncbi:putative hydrolase of the HAD superfamily [Nocardia tenerifensis]|uniref:Putative hydrolase of the HAD superfamily n=1 Tax=Nocardia tenerifensis TaxID=228006 RepID=A0A318JPX7_9NOCA|nr:HAD-IA family hydrolase [Nocardia tenerifensis]PXX54882.1 putative hydrolase of the HAD superfamily [Nocardia tenerifensis]